jgi:putative membrane protein
MVRMLIRLALQVAGNAIALIIAAAVLDDMSLEWDGFLIALAIFTGVTMIAQPLLVRMAVRSVEALRGGVALLTAFVGLLVTDLVADALNIDGAMTWILATIIVWLGGLLAGILLPMIFLKEAVEPDQPATATYRP